MADGDGFEKVAQAGEIPEGESRSYAYGDGEVLVCRQNGEFFAVENMCSHAKSPLETGPVANEFQVKCPLHGARFDVRSGKAMCLPAVMPIKTFLVEQRGEDIWIGKK